MAWIPDDMDKAREQARRAMSLPIGLSSPLWMAFGAAAGAGVAWWWATRWTRAVNLEAIAGAAKAQVEAVEAFVEKETEVATGAVEAAEKVLAAATILEPRETSKVAAEPEETFAERTPESDDLTQLAGIGPKLAATLYEKGIETFAQIAEWSEDQAAEFDAEMGLRGRVARDEWVAQARKLARQAGAN